jgi:hypothetical protein
MKRREFITLLGTSEGLILDSGESTTVKALKR